MCGSAVLDLCVCKVSEFCLLSQHFQVRLYSQNTYGIKPQASQVISLSCVTSGRGVELDGGGFENSGCGKDWS